eukprot:355667_1
MSIENTQNKVGSQFALRIDQLHISTPTTATSVPQLQDEADTDQNIENNKKNHHHIDRWKKRNIMTSDDSKLLLDILHDCYGVSNMQALIDQPGTGCWSKVRSVFAAYEKAKNEDNTKVTSAVVSKKSTRGRRCDDEVPSQQRRSRERRRTHEDNKHHSRSRSYGGARDRHTHRHRHYESLDNASRRTGRRGRSRDRKRNNNRTREHHAHRRKRNGGYRGGYGSGGEGYRGGGRVRGGDGGYRGGGGGYSGGDAKEY